MVYYTKYQEMMREEDLHRVRQHCFKYRCTKEQMIDHEKIAEDAYDQEYLLAQARELSKATKLGKYLTENEMNELVHSGARRKASEVLHFIHTGEALEPAPQLKPRTG